MRTSAYSLRRAAMTRDSRAWFGPGRELRVRARRAASCVECGRALATRRTPYCSRGCRWRFHGRYFWDSARRVVLRRDRYTCRSCGLRTRQSALEVDHILEIARGGAPLDYANLQTLCRPCHRAKTVRFLRERAREGTAPVPSTLTLPLGDDSDWFPS